MLGNIMGDQEESDQDQDSVKEVSYLFFPPYGSGFTGSDSKMYLPLFLLGSGSLIRLMIQTNQIQVSKKAAFLYAF